MFFVSEKPNQLRFDEREPKESPPTDDISQTLPRGTVAESASDGNDDKVFFFGNDVAWELLLRRPNRFPGAGT